LGLELGLGLKTCGLGLGERGLGLATMGLDNISDNNIKIILFLIKHASIFCGQTT